MESETCEEERHVIAKLNVILKKIIKSLHSINFLVKHISLTLFDCTPYIFLRESERKIEREK